MKEKHWKLFRNPALLTFKERLRALISRRKGGREGRRGKEKGDKKMRTVLPSPSPTHQAG